MKAINHSISLPRRVVHGLMGGLRRDAGASAVEFALIIPFLLMLTGAIIEMTNLYFIRNQLNDIVRDAARRVAVGALEGEAAEKLVLIKLAETTDARAKVAVSETGEKEAIDVTVSLKVSLTDILIFQGLAESLGNWGDSAPILSVDATMFKH